MLQRSTLISFIIAGLIGLCVYGAISVMELRRSEQLSQQVLERVYSRALRELYAFLQEAREHLAQPKNALSAYSPLAAFLSDAPDGELEKVSVTDNQRWQIDVDLAQLTTQVQPGQGINADGTVLLLLEEATAVGQPSLAFEFELGSWLQQIINDTALADIPFNLVYRGQAMFANNNLKRQDNEKVANDFISHQLHLILDSQQLRQQLQYQNLPLTAALLLALCGFFCAQGGQWLWRQRMGFYRRYLHSQLELEQTENILREQVTTSAHGQKELLKSNYQLQSENSDFEQVKQRVQMSDRLATLGEMSAGIVHEINNPIAYINSNLTELEKDLNSLNQFIGTLDKASDYLDIKSEFYQELLAAYDELQIQDALSEAPERLQDCISGIERVRKIVDDMKRLSHKGGTEKQICNLNDGLESVLRIANSRIKGDIELRTYLIDLPDIYCNSSQINQVISNILVNAIQAIGEEKGSISLTERIEEGRIEIEICDDGPGMDMATAERIFEPFFTTKEQGEGTGMGLALCYKLIQEHGGDIQLSTRLGKGSCFTIFLPCTYEELNHAE